MSTSNYEDTVSYICVNSSDRDTTAYPHVNKYRINLETVIKNVCSIEIISGSIANQNTPLANPYLIFKTDEHDHLIFSNDNINSGFALLYLKATTGAHVQPELGCLQRNVRYFKTPLAKLSHINVGLFTPSGALFSFGEATGDTTVTYSNSFVFKIISKDVRRNESESLY